MTDDRTSMGATSTLRGFTRCCWLTDHLYVPLHAEMLVCGRADGILPVRSHPRRRSAIPACQFRRILFLEAISGSTSTRIQGRWGFRPFYCHLNQPHRVIFALCISENC